MTLRGTIAVVVAGICGVLAAFGVAAALIHPMFLFIPVAGPQIFLFAIGLVAVIPLAQRWLPPARGSVLALFPLTIGSHLLMAILAPRNLGEPVMLALSMVFAISAVAVHEAVRRIRFVSGPLRPR